MNASKQTKSAHPLFPPDQAFLWLPGFAGPERPYCSYNEYREHPGGYDRRRFELLPPSDSNGVPFVPPYPVSPETYISWHTNVSPPYPYHPVPVARGLTPKEMEEIGARVQAILSPTFPISSDDPTGLLRNEHKCQVLAALAQMGLLPVETSVGYDARIAS